MQSFLETRRTVWSLQHEKLCFSQTKCSDVSQLSFQLNRQKAQLLINKWHCCFLEKWHQFVLFQQSMTLFLVWLVILFFPKHDAVQAHVWMTDTLKNRWHFRWLKIKNWNAQELTMNVLTLWTHRADKVECMQWENHSEVQWDHTRHHKSFHWHSLLCMTMSHNINFARCQCLFLGNFNTQQTLCLMFTRVLQVLQMCDWACTFCVADWLCAQNEQKLKNQVGLLFRCSCGLA